MDENNQKRKYMLSLSGEFLVAGELLRRNISAAVTYGNAKKADVVAVSGNTASSIEVKTTQKTKWVIGARVPELDDSIWILVYLPSDEREPAEFYISTSFELNAILKPREDAWLKKSREKHGRPMRGVYLVHRDEIKNHKGAWQKLITKLAQTN
jgi:hypothetical protein